MHVLRLPSLAENIIEATLLRWDAIPGQTVRLGQGIAQLVTEKAAFDYETPQTGILTHQLAPPGSVLPVGYVLALLDAGDAEAAAFAAENEALLARHALALAGGMAAPPEAGRPPGMAAPAAPTPLLPPAAASDAAIRATPAARRLAKELNVGLAEVARKRPGDLLREEHVREFASGRGAMPPPA